MMTPPGKVVFVMSRFRITKFFAGSMLAPEMIFEKVTTIGSACGIGAWGVPAAPLLEVIEITIAGTGSGPNDWPVWKSKLSDGCVVNGGGVSGSAKTLGPTGCAELPPKRNP